MVISIIPVISVYAIARNLVIEGNYRNVDYILNMKYTSINDSINNYLNTVSKSGYLISQNTDIKHFLGNQNDKSCEKLAENKILNLFEQQKKIDDSIQNIILYDINKKVVLCVNSDGSNEVREIINDSNNKLSEKISVFFECNVNGAQSVCFSYLEPIVDNDNTVDGYVAVIYSTSFLQKYIKYNSENNNLISMIVDKKGNIFEFPYVSLSSINDTIRYSQIKNMFSDAQYNKNEIKKVSIDETNKRCFAKKTDMYGYTIISYMDELSIKNSIQGSLSELFVTALLVIILIVFITIVFAFIYFRTFEQLLVSCRDKLSGKSFSKIKYNKKTDMASIINACNKMADEISECNERYKTIVEMNDNIVFEYDIINDNFVYGKNFYKKFSFRPASFRYDDSFLNKCPLYHEDIGKYEEFINAAFIDKSTAQAEFRLRTVYGDYVWFIVRCALLYDKDMLPIKIIGIIVDIDNAKKFEDKLIKKADYDSLTHLLNRETFEKRLSAEYALYLMRKQSTAIVFIDIDDFKIYNDNYSHACGDEVLQFIAVTIQNELKNEGFAGRYGGDEFVICISCDDAEIKTLNFVKRLKKALCTGFECLSAKQRLSIKSSIGISYFSEERNNLKTVIKEADEAMYLVKKNGKSDYKEYMR